VVNFAQINTQTNLIIQVINKDAVYYIV